MHHHHSRNTENRSYSYLSPKTSTPSQNTHYQYYNFLLPTQQSLYSNTTSTVKYIPSHSQQQQQYQPPPTTISDLAEPLSVFDDLKLPRHRQSTITSYPSVYIPPNPSRQTSVSDARLATASAIRERLLTDIQHNINEIDQELSLLERRSSFLHYTPSRLSSLTVMRQTSMNKKTPSLNNNNNQAWPDKPKRIYEVVPRIPSAVKTISQSSISKFTDQTNSLSYIGQYHYGPEVEENEIAENDPENSDVKSTVNEISEYDFQETFSLDKFHREQSALSQYRALIFVPEYVDNNKIEFNEIADDFQQNNPVNISIAQLSTVKSSHPSGSSNKLSIEDFQLLVQTAPKPITPDKKETDSINTILSTPVRHTRLSIQTEKTHTSPQQTMIETKNNTDVDIKYFFSDFGNEGEEDLISIDPSHLTIPNELDIVPDDSISNILIQQSQTSLLNPHSSMQEEEKQQEQQLVIQNNNEHVNETKNKRIDSKKKDIIPSTLKLPSKKMSPIPIKDKKQIQLPMNKSKVNQNRRKTSSIISDKSIFEREPSETKFMNFSIQLQPVEQNSLQNTNFSRNRSISSVFTHKTSNKSRQNSPLPIPLNSPDLNNIRPSTPRSPTPERRKSISSFNQDVLLTSTDLITFDNPSIDPFQINSERNAPSPLRNLKSLIEIQSNKEEKPSSSPLKSTSLLINETIQTNPDYLRLPSISPRHSDISDANLTSVDREETFRPAISPKKLDEELLSITQSQRRSNLSLLVYRSKSKEKTQTDTINSSSMNHENKSEQHRHVLFSNQILHIPIEKTNSLNNWRERIDHILERKHHFTNKKYSHIKSRVNTFANFEYQTKSMMTLSKKKLSKTKNNKQQIHSIKRSTPQIFGRIQYLPNGRTKIFHESIKWNVQSKIKSYSLENFHYKSQRNHIKIINKKPKWHSESKLSKVKNNKSIYHHILTQNILLPTTISNIDEFIFQQKEFQTERKIFDINSNGQQLQENIFNNSSKRSNKLIFNEKLLWTKNSKLKNFIWENINYQSKKSKLQIFHQPIHWNSQSKLQITWEIQAKIKYWSTIDLQQLTKNKSIFSEYHNLQWNDLILDDHYPLLENHLKDESPANRPKWNSVSKTQSVNTVYNPKIINSNTIRRGWDLELRRKRVHNLPPLKRKRNHEKIPQLSIETPPSNNPLVVDYNYDHSHDRTTSLDYAITPSRRSSRALVSLPRLPDLQLLSETPRSQRPIQQEWYNESSRSRLTNRTDMIRTRNNSIQDSVQQTNSLRESLTLRSSTRNSQHSVVSGTLLDSSIRTNRATELRLSRDMEEHHQHCHDPSQSMPFEIRGFRLEGTQLTVPDNATIRPLSNINYRTSERVKTRRIYPWSNLHSNGTLSRNSSLLPITEFQHPSFETSVIEIPQLIHEE